VLDLTKSQAGMQLMYCHVATVAWLTYLLIDISLQLSDFSTCYETHIQQYLCLFWHFYRAVAKNAAIQSVCENVHCNFAYLLQEATMM
jgi:hypothetical protein